MNARAKKNPTIASMLQQIGSPVTAINGRLVSFQVSGRVFDYDTNVQKFRELLPFGFRTVGAEEVRTVVKSNVHTA